MYAKPPLVHTGETLGEREKQGLEKQRMERGKPELSSPGRLDLKRVKEVGCRTSEDETDWNN